MQYDASLDDLLFPQKIPPLFSAAKTYTDDMIAVEAARLAYFRFDDDAQSRQAIESALGLVGFGQVEYFSGAAEDGHALAAVQTFGNKALLAFRGTVPNEFKDIELDLELERVPWPEGGSVHKGFAEQFEELSDGVRAWRDRVAAGRQLFVIGHSLGAGLATLCATRLKPCTLVTIGSSRVGDAAFVNLFAGAEVHRFVGCCDIITRLPGTVLGYEHVGGEGIYIARDGTLPPNPTHDFVKKDEDAARWNYLVKYAWRLGDVPCRDVADHAPINYVTAVLRERDN